ncbi:PREDICTED: uncharacterized protein LOC109471327 [Branchiostoma belcheri]|uniref:Uncharacterized protein LOC109471327 n=1 Tax=Branchiostoma belcheri TaxID=7741 RepID=A0A6P4YWR2_BRABE|nr:PREDICTED: uncharacterized protein LOC109471327 [Branchiostoma belcheri]
MSMSIPVAFQPYQLDRLFTFIDGGLSANFPLYAFDGWYLSMDKSLTFHRHLQSMGDLSIHQLFYPEYRKDRFKSPESGSDEFFKTLGALVERTTQKTLSGTGNHMTTEEARRLFYKTINERDVKRLQVRTKEEAFKMLLLNEKGELTDNKIKNLYQNFLPLQNAKMEILGERPVSTAGQYYGTLMDFVGSKNQLTEEDVGRCIGVDVDYLSTMDFDMEPADMEFLMKQGVAAATTFLCEYIDKQTGSAASRRTPIFLVAER